MEGTAPKVVHAILNPWLSMISPTREVFCFNGFNEPWDKIFSLVQTTLIKLEVSYCSYSITAGKHLFSHCINKIKRHGAICFPNIWLEYFQHTTLSEWPLFLEQKTPKMLATSKPEPGRAKRDSLFAERF